MKKPLIVFFGVHESDEDGADELVERAKSLRCVCFGNEITDIGLKRRADIKRKFYFTAANGEENINQAIAMINHCRSAENGIYNTSNTEFYIFSNSRESEALLDMVDNGNIKVRRVNEKRNLVLNAVVDHPIFENAKAMPDGGKRMTALIIGMGSYGKEFMKTLCWCGQLPNYKLALHIADKNSDILSHLRQSAPELLETRANGGDSYNAEEPYYEIYDHPGIDVSNDSLDKMLNEIELPTNVFVTLGTDEANVEVSMKVRSILRRRVNKEGGAHPNIYTVVYSSVKNDTFENGLKIVGKADYDITFIGDMKSRYSLKVIEQEMLDKIGMRVHLGWTLRSVNRSIENYITAREALLANPSDDKLKAELDEKTAQLNKSISGIPQDESRYRKYEYFRRASIASVVHMLVMKNMGIEFAEKEEAQLLEHKRWCAFMRCAGYVKQSESGRDYVAKTHYDLRLFSKLSPEDRIKDSIEVYRYIRKSEKQSDETRN